MLKCLQKKIIINLLNNHMIFEVKIDFPFFFSFLFGDNFSLFLYSHFLVLSFSFF